jgi:hypothetical protein
MEMEDKLTALADNGEVFPHHRCQFVMGFKIIDGLTQGKIN